jgi:hypothetical protein
MVPCMYAYVASHIAVVYILIRRKVRKSMKLF